MADDAAFTLPVTDTSVLRLSADIVAAYVSNNALPPGEIAAVVASVHAALSSLGQAEPPRASAEKPKPAVPVSRSIQPDHLVCLEDGKQLKMLKRYLWSQYQMTPEDYRRKWALPPDYPMVAPSYAARRSDFARQIGLGKGVRRKSA